jgi:hypothetical protein
MPPAIPTPTATSTASRCSALARSRSRDASGNLVYDSADLIEQLTATRTPTLFNSDGAAASFDTRSDNKGPEPEGVVIGTINTRIYAFVGLERVGDILVFDVSVPTAPQFVQYINTPEDVSRRRPEPSCRPPTAPPASRC